MSKTTKNIFPIFTELISRKQKELLLSQKGLTIWLTGLSGSGKTTIGKYLEKKLNKEKKITKLLDGDNLRVGLNSDLGFSNEDRSENIRRVAEVSKLFVECGLVTINCFVSPSEKQRQLARSIIGKENFYEVYIDASVDECEKRDVKGLYAKAKKGLIPNFTGISAGFDKPNNSDIVINTTKQTIKQSGDKLFDFILPLIKI